MTGERILIAASAFAGGCLGMYLVGRLALACPGVLERRAYC